MGVIGLYPNVLHVEGLAALYKVLGTRDNKEISSDKFSRIAGIVLKNNRFEFDEKTFKEKRGTAIETTFARPYAISFMGDLEEKMLGTFKKKQ